MKLLARVVNIFNAIIVISLANQKTMEGVAFSVRKRFTIAASGTLDIIMDPTAVTKDNVVLLPMGFVGFGGPIHVDVYVGATENGDGNPVFTYNRNLVLGVLPETDFRTDFTGLDITGLDAIELLLPSDGVGAAMSSGADVGEPLVLNVDKTEKILLRFINTDGTAAVTVGVKVDFFEVNI